MTSTIQRKMPESHAVSEDTHGLRKAVLTPLETLAQSIAGIAPSATPGLLIPIVFGFAGNGMWLSYVIATIGMIFTARCINEFASRSACPGSLYSFVSIGFGARAGMLVGWALMFAYVVCGSACITELAIYADSLLQHFAGWHINRLLLIFAGALPIAFIAYKNIKLSASLMLKLELASIAFILLLVGLCIQHQGFTLDTKQIFLQGVSLDNVRMGLVMAIFGFAAFESSASLGIEASQPLRTIPRAIMQSVILTGGFFVICSYAMVQNFHTSSVTLDKCATPLLNMSESVGMPALGHVIDVCIMVSFFAAGLANLNAGARMIFKMGRDRLIHSSLGRAHVANGTPHVAVLISSAISVSIAMILASLDCKLMDIVGWLGSLATFGFMYGYFATSLSAAKFLRSRKQLGAAQIAMVSCSLLVLTLALIGSLYPLPAYPYNILPIIFATFMIAGLIKTRPVILDAGESGRSQPPALPVASSE